MVKSTIDMWEAGAKALAILIAIFSGELLLLQRCTRSRINVMLTNSISTSTTRSLALYKTANDVCYLVCSSVLSIVQTERQYTTLVGCVGEMEHG
jgi:hypothetical protein